MYKVITNEFHGGKVIGEYETLKDADAASWNFNQGDCQCGGCSYVAHEDGTPVDFRAMSQDELAELEW